MNDMVFQLAQDSIFITLMLAAPLLLSALVAGLLVSLLQAIMQINEITLTFIPKVVAIVIVFLFMAPWMSELLTSYTSDLLESLPTYIY